MGNKEGLERSSVVCSVWHGASLSVPLKKYGSCEVSIRVLLHQSWGLVMAVILFLLCVCVLSSQTLSSGSYR